MALVNSLMDQQINRMRTIAHSADGSTKSPCLFSGPQWRPKRGRLGLHCAFRGRYAPQRSVFHSNSVSTAWMAPATPVNSTLAPPISSEPMRLRGAGDTCARQSSN